MSDEIVTTTVRMSVELHTAIRIRAAYERVTVASLLIEFMEAGMDARRAADDVAAHSDAREASYA